RAVRRQSPHSAPQPLPVAWRPWAHPGAPLDPRADAPARLVEQTGAAGVYWPAAPPCSRPAVGRDRSAALSRDSGPPARQAPPFGRPALPPAPRKRAAWDGSRAQLPNSVPAPDSASWPASIALWEAQAERASDPPVL